MNGLRPNDAPKDQSSLLELFEADMDEKLDKLRPRFETTLRELIRLYMDWSGEAPHVDCLYREDEFARSR